MGNYADRPDDILWASTYRRTDQLRQFLALVRKNLESVI
jgi:hypothetical protein